MARTAATLVGATLLACGAAVLTPPANSDLESARSAYETAAEDPAIPQKAADELARAEETLGRADAAWRQGAAGRDIELLAYLVKRRVLVARAAASREAGDADLPAEDPTQIAAASGPQLQRELAELEAQHLDVALTSRGLVVTLARSLFGPSELKPLAREMLDRVARFLSQNPGRPVSVEGYTDTTGSESYNDRVSLERAEAASSYLQLRGVPTSQLSATGHGSERPRFPNSSRAGRRLNRRVEIVIAPT
jgi:outer membrane protein OmpA-like peptidoglycan-associated protein